MRLREVEIRNFRSLRHVKLDGLSDLVILIGRNGSGKSNILEALELFFADLNLATDVEKQATPELWFDKRTEPPIDIRVVLELQQYESGNDDLHFLFSAEVLTALRLTTFPSKPLFLTIQRQIVRKVWKNVAIELTGIFSVNDGKVNLLNEPQPPPRPSAAAESVLAGDPILSSGPGLEPQIAQDLLKGLTDGLKNEFKLIRGPRESTERTAAPARPAILDLQSKSFFTTLALEKDRTKEETWTQYAEDFEAISGRRLQVRGTEVEFRQRDLALPLELSGSGDQALLILMRHFNQEKFFYGIEEPETRLHHDYIRKLFEYLRKIAEDWQVFIATHSPIFVDKAFLDNTWLTRIKGKETKVARVDKGELRDVLFELGVRPSDFFFANQVLLVEGRTEEIFIPLLAEKAGLDFTNVRVLPTGGKDGTDRHLTVWLEAADQAGIPAYILGDKNAKDEIQQLVKARKADRDRCKVLDKGSLRDSEDCDVEDFYPKTLLHEALEHLYKDRVNLEKLDLGEHEPVARKISAALNSKSWKTKVARYIGETLKEEHLENELRDIVSFLRQIPESKR